MRSASVERDPHRCGNGKRSGDEREQQSGAEQRQVRAHRDARTALGRCEQPGGDAGIGATPTGLAIAPDGCTLYVAERDRVDRLRALKFGAKIIEVAPMAMIEGVTLTTTTTYVNNHEEECRSLIMAMIDGTHFFKTNKQDTLKILQQHCSELLKIRNDEEWDCFYENQVQTLESVPYPSLAALQNVFALAVKRNPEIKEFNPLALWDLHYVKEIDDSGYVRKLYAQ